jgi:hypothetical protein
VPSKAKRWPALTSATGEEDCDDAAMSGIKGKRRPVGHT